MLNSKILLLDFGPYCICMLCFACITSCLFLLPLWIYSTFGQFTPIDAIYAQLLHTLLWISMCAHSCNGLIISPSTTVPHTSLGAVTYFTIHIPTTLSTSYFNKSTALASQSITLMRFCVDLWGFRVFESIFSVHSFCIVLDVFLFLVKPW